MILEGLKASGYSVYGGVNAPYVWIKTPNNVTSFLGILNYLAEKRTQIVSNHKHYRTVIVDNPFGKASSDHVLSPVFFIAEQLSFQIIALTAYAEGKFIRTYFPIVYSCRLRTADNGSSQIMTKEREIKKLSLWMVILRLYSGWGS